MNTHELAKLLLATSDNEVILKENKGYYSSIYKLNSIEISASEICLNIEEVEDSED